MSHSIDGELYRAYQDAILRRVCGVCLDQRDDGTCGLTKRTCAIQDHLPAVVNAVVAVQSDRMDEYEDAVRAQVCAPCGREDAQGRCLLRDHGECALNTYLFLVVEAVEEVREAIAFGERASTQ